MPHAKGIARHRFLDTAITCAAAHTALTHKPSSTEESGVAAGLRADKKCSKYVSLCSAVSSEFIPAVIERGGTFDDRLVGFVKSITGDHDRDPALEDYTFSTRSNTSYLAGRMCFAAILADAYMIDSIIGLDTRHDDPQQSPPPGAAQHGRPQWPTQQDIEGIGGQMPYETARGR